MTTLQKRQQDWVLARVKDAGLTARFRKGVLSVDVPGTLAVVTFTSDELREAGNDGRVIELISAKVVMRAAL